MPVLNPKKMPGISDRGRLGIVAIALFLGIAGLIVARTDWDQRLSTRVLDLLPSSDDSLERRFMVGVIQDRQANQMRFALTDLPRDQVETANDFAKEFLLRSGAFKPEILTDREVVDRAAGFLFENRMSLLFPHWLAQRANEWQTLRVGGSFHDWLAIRVADDLDRFLSSPNGFFYSELVASDPLLLMSGLQDSVLEGMGSGGVETILTAQLAGSAFDPGNQALIAENIANLKSELAREFPGSRLLVSGTALFAGHSRTTIRSEVGRINLLSLLMVLLVATICLRNPVGLVGLMPVVACGLIGGLLSVVLFFGQVHIMSLIMGAFLAGITVDYGFHAFLSPSGEDRARLWKPLTAAVGSTGAGFAILLFASLPVIRQLGVFVTTGAGFALLAAVALKPAIGSRLVGARALFVRPLVRVNPGKWTVIVLAILLGILAGGVFRIEWHDDVRELDMPSPELLAADRAIRRLAGGTVEGTAFLTTGSDFLEAVDRFRGFQGNWINTELDSLASLASVLPTRRELSTARVFLDAEESDRWLKTLMVELDRTGYDSAAFGAFTRKWSNMRIVDFQDAPIEGQLLELSDLLVGPVSFLLIEADGIHAVASIAPGSSTVRVGNPDPEFHTINASQLENLNQVFSRYRKEIWGLLWIGLSVVAIGVVFVYRPVAGVGILLVPVTSTFAAFGLLGWLVQGLNLFHLLAGLLGFCLALDYSLFAWEARRRREAPPASVRVSGLTTLAAFGALAMSRLPAVSALGLAVGLIVLVTLISVEILGGVRNTESKYAVASKVG